MNDGMAAPASGLREVPRKTAPTLLGAAPRRPIVMVLGMHRSGTSLCSHVLSALGLDMTDNMAAPGHEVPAQDNPLGHWERWAIVEFHDRILRFFNRGFFSPGHDFALPVAWWADPRVAEVRREITAFLEQRMGNGYFGFKDPRTVRLIPMWHQIISELKLAPKIVFCLRNPAQVARSLHLRDGFSLDTGEYRWFSYTVDFFRYTKSAEICTIEYESWFDDPAPNLTKLRNFLDLPEDWAEFDLDLSIAGLVRHELRHDDARLSEASQPLIRSVYKLARRAEHDTAAREQAQTIAAQFVTFQQLQGAFQRDFEQQAAAAARLPALEEEAVALHERAAAAEALEAEVDRQRAQLADLARERDETAAALASARAEIEDLRNAVALSEREADERTAAATAMQSKFGEIHEALTEAQKRAEEGDSAAAALRAEIVAVRGALVDTERRVVEAEAVPEIRTELARLADMLARAEQEIWERAGLIETMRAEMLSLGEELSQNQRDALKPLAEVARLGSEIAGLHETMADTERETAGLRGMVARARRDAEHSAATVKSLEGELAAAQSALGAARQIGRAAINALAMGNRAPLDRHPRFRFRLRHRTIITRADRARDAGEWQRAAGLYGIALERTPNNAPIWIQYGHALKESGSPAEAETAYRTAIAYAPADADAHLQLGHVLKLQGKRAEAEVAYRRAWALDRSLADAARELGAFGWTKQRLAEAMDRFTATPARDEPRATASINGPERRSSMRRRKEGLITHADRAQRARQWPLAARLYRRALDRNPDNPPIWVQYGHALKESGSFPDAEAAYRRALGYDSTIADSHQQLGQVLKLQDRTEEAQAAYLHAFALDPSLPHAPQELVGLGWSERALTELKLLAEPTPYLVEPTPHNGHDVAEPTLSASALASQLAPPVADSNLDPTLWFFIGDTIDWLQAHEQVTGVGRVTVELFLASLDRESEHQAIPCVLDNDGRDLVSVSRFETVFYLASRMGTHTVSDLLNGTDEPAPPAVPLPSPRFGDHVVFTGVVWTPAYTDLFRRLSENGISFSVFVYDIIPIEQPGLVDALHREGFLDWLKATITLASVIFVSSVMIKNQILKWAVISGMYVRGEIVPIKFGMRNIENVRSCNDLKADVVTSRVKLESFVLSVGTIDNRKNQALLCRLWKRLVSDLGFSRVPQLVLVGREDLKIADLDVEVASLVKASKIVVLEGLSDAELVGLYRACLFTSLPSLSEGYGLPVAESLQHGKLCISSDLAVIREHAGDLPWYFDPADETTAYDLLRQAIEDPDARTAAERRITRLYRPCTWTSSYRTISEAAYGRSGGRAASNPAPIKPYRPVIPGVPAAAPLTTLQQ